MKQCLQTDGEHAQNSEPITQSHIVAYDVLKTCGSAGHFIA